MFLEGKKKSIFAPVLTLYTNLDCAFQLGGVGRVVFPNLVSYFLPGSLGSSCDLSVLAKREVPCAHRTPLCSTSIVQWPNGCSTRTPLWRFKRNTQGVCGASLSSLISTSAFGSERCLQTGTMVMANVMLVRSIPLHLAWIRCLSSSFTCPGF